MTLFVTNNDMFKEKHDNLSVEFVEGGHHDVLVFARDKIHMGWKLETHPLAGNIKPSQMPYRTIQMSLEQAAPSRPVDVSSLLLIESAIDRCLLDRQLTPAIDREVLEDYKLVDLSIIEGALQEEGGA